MMTPHHFFAIVLATSSLASAQYSLLPTRHFSNPVQPPGFANDPDLTTRRPLVLLTPTEATFDDIESTSDSLLTTETIAATTPTSSSPPTSSTLFASSTPTTQTNHADSQTASSNTPSLITFTGTQSAKPSAPSSTSNPASVPTAFANAAIGLIAIVGLAMAL
ncbi:hypothetical protein V8C37DRAFT_61522 [Trichoderma ceciliae]